MSKEEWDDVQWEENAVSKHSYLQKLASSLKDKMKPKISLHKLCSSDPNDYNPF